jgi:hypothetical protein
MQTGADFTQRFISSNLKAGDIYLKLPFLSSGFFESESAVLLPCHSVPRLAGFTVWFGLVFVPVCVSVAPSGYVVFVSDIFYTLH